MSADTRCCLPGARAIAPGHGIGIFIEQSSFAGYCNNDISFFMPRIDTYGVQRSALTSPMSIEAVRGDEAYAGNNR